jgi:hypothetical protein
MNTTIIKKSPTRVEVWAGGDGDWTFAPDEDLLDTINLWVQQNELGHRDSYNGWKLRDPPAMTLFLLRWDLN